MTLIGRTDRTFPVTAQGRSPLAPTEAFDLVVPIDLSVVFRPWGPFPGVAGVSDQTGPWNQVGTSRTPQLTDGTTAAERLTEYDQGRSFAYELTGFTNVLGRLVHGVRGEWTFTADGPGTVVRWTYEFKPRRALAWLVRAGLVPLWRIYMQASLERTISFLESDRSTTPT